MIKASCFVAFLCFVESCWTFLLGNEVLRRQLQIDNKSASISLSASVNDEFDAKRRRIIASAGSILSLSSTMLPLPADATSVLQAMQIRASASRDASSLYVLSPRRNSIKNSALSPSFSDKNYQSSVELCLLKVLPVKNTLFNNLVTILDDASAINSADPIDARTWDVTSKSIELAIRELDTKRSQFNFAFNPEDATLLQILKGETCERRVEELRSQLVDLVSAAQQRNATAFSLVQRKALLSLSEVGELLVPKFPYEVPTQGMFSYLPRLQGRARVTFVMRRNRNILGNITILADGYTAPITAGNFVDLSIRNFYTGLPVKTIRKKLVRGSEFEVASLPILGQFQEGFYDPLTGKPRHLPLEIIREEQSGVPVLTYSQGLSSLPDVSLESADQSKPLLSFRTPGLVAMNHPDRLLNGASSEFFALQETSVLENKRDLLDGEFAPFGYIIEGFDLFQKLQSNDVIEDTIVDEFGQLSLIKIRRSSFSEVVQASSDDKDST
ncbi:hypothetical protein FisN_10Hu002 [Fistulifera solaris]|uniref:peptidylprolyl isomerase n=1 Tax=Fistulifera solaris TaxID=1519565 RepID=A0A1Z5K5C2_FISSO|nr:hypothetical protein FisN_10Hu002 [Fistulifera solaris]|eukprot:GAX21424.1 hypothetical protein FisN_10Hu002 [Fistulifera solaris]